MALVGELVFLGVTISNKGTFVCKHTSFSSRVWALWNRLSALGFQNHPAAWLKAYSIFVEPAVLYGCEVWGAGEALKVL